MTTSPSGMSTFVVGAFGAVAGLGLGALLWATGGSANEPPWGVGSPSVADQALLTELRELTRLLRDERERGGLLTAPRTAGSPAGGAAPASAVEPLDVSALEQAERVSTAFGAHVERLGELLAASPVTSLYRVSDPTPERRAELLAELSARYDTQRDRGTPRPEGRSWFGASTADLRASLGVPANVMTPEGGRTTWTYIHEGDDRTDTVNFQFVDGYVTGVYANAVN